MKKDAESTLIKLGFGSQCAGKGRPPDCADNEAAQKGQSQSRSPGALDSQNETKDSPGTNAIPAAQNAIKAAFISGIHSHTVPPPDTLPPATENEHMVSDGQSLHPFEPSDWDYIDADLGMNADLFGLNDESYIDANLDASSFDQSILGQDATCPSLSDPSVIDNEPIEALVDQLSDRVGTLQLCPDGQTRFYGPTSNFNLVEMPAPDNLTVHRTVRNDGQEYLEAHNLEKEIPEDLEKHLTDLYFAWQDPFLRAVDQKMYERSKVLWTECNEETPYYSESLRNAM